MTVDGFRRVLHNAGELIVVDDFMRLQRQIKMSLHEMLMYPGIGNLGGDSSAGGLLGGPLDPEQMTGMYADGASIPTDVALCPYPGLAYVYPGGSALQLLCQPGPIVQVIGDANHGDPLEDTEEILAYWIASGDVDLTTTAGDATNPRIDIVEMRLQLVDDTLTSRAVIVDAVRASLDIAPLTSNCETVIRARFGGIGGNSISLQFVADGTGAGSLTQNGNTLVFHYETAVTTVADFETAVAASTLIEVQTADAVGTLTAPGDTFSATFLTGGVDRYITSGSVNKARRVQATFQVKAGTPAANPTYPVPTAGFCVLGAVLVPATHAVVHAATSLRDVRLPLGGLSVLDVNYNEINIAGSGSGPWTLDHVAWKALSPAFSTFAYAICPSGGNCGRLVGMSVFGEGDFSAILLRRATVGAGGAGSSPTYVSLADLITIRDGLDPGPAHAGVDIIDMMDNTSLSGVRAANTRLGNPIWTNGQACGPGRGLTGAFVVGSYDATIEKLCVEFATANTTRYLGLIRFYVARGLAF
jgi:hypothetical protein